MVVGPCLGRAWTVSGLCLDCVWTVSGLCLDFFWTVSGLCLDRVWIVCGMCLSRVCECPQRYHHQCRGNASTHYEKLTRWFHITRMDRMSILRPADLLRALFAIGFRGHVFGMPVLLCLHHPASDTTLVF